MQKERLDVYIDSPKRAFVEAGLSLVGYGREYDGVVGPFQYQFNESADGRRTLAIQGKLAYLAGGVTRESEEALRELCTQAAETWGIKPKDMHFHGYTKGLDTKDLRGQIALNLDRKKTA